MPSEMGQACYKFNRVQNENQRQKVGIYAEQRRGQGNDKEIDVAETYGPPRVVTMAEQMGLRANWNLDLTARDENGDAWDCNKASMRNKAARKLIQDKPRLLIGSPICTPFNQMNNINHPKMPKEEDVEQRLDHGRMHLEFCAKLYDIQRR